MDETRPERMVRRKVVFGLAIFCIILASGEILMYGYLMGAIENRDTTIRARDYQIGALQDQVYDLNRTVHMENAQNWLYFVNMSQPAGGYTPLNFSAPYPGKIWIEIDHPTTEVYVRVLWDIGDAFTFDEQFGQFYPAGRLQTVPVLSFSNVEIRIGNNNTDVGSTETVSIVYWY